MSDKDCAEPGLPKIFDSAGVSPCPYHKAKVWEIGLDSTFSLVAGANPGSSLCNSLRRERWQADDVAAGFALLGLRLLDRRDAAVERVDGACQLFAR
jgi:hypothetical protein